VIQQHLKKLFSGIHTVTLPELPPTIVAMNSSLFESVRLLHVIDVDEVVEKWLEALSLEMADILKTELKKIAKANMICSIGTPTRSSASTTKSSSPIRYKRRSKTICWRG
jgi:hypothetical protein